VQTADEAVERESSPAPLSRLLLLGNCGRRNRQGVRELVRTLPGHCSMPGQCVFCVSS